jgi:hypothetical protein
MAFDRAVAPRTRPLCVPTALAVLLLAATAAVLLAMGPTLKIPGVVHQGAVQYEIKPMTEAYDHGNGDVHIIFFVDRAGQPMHPMPDEGWKHTSLPGKHDLFVTPTSHATYTCSRGGTTVTGTDSLGDIGGQRSQYGVIRAPINSFRFDKYRAWR